MKHGRNTGSFGVGCEHFLVRAGSTGLGHKFPKGKRLCGPGERAPAMKERVIEATGAAFRWIGRPLQDAPPMGHPWRWRLTDG